MCRKTRLFGNRLVVNLCKPKYKMYRWLLVMLVIVGYVTFITVSAAGGAPGSGTMNKSEQSQKYRQLIHEALARYEALHNDKNPAGGVKEVARVKRQTGGETAPACVAFRTQDPNHLANGEYLVDDTLTDCAGDGQRPRYRHKLRSQYLYFYRDNIFNVNRWVQYSSVSCLPFSSFFCDATTKSPAGLPSSCWKEGFLGISVPATVSTCADACVSDPCQHGTCNGVFTTQQNTYTCTCDRGWKGTNCDQDILECASTPCQNNGICQERTNRYTCNCPLGFSGVNCEIDVCDPSPCVHGVCEVAKDNTARCACEAGWTGATCSTDILECASSPCLNDAACVDLTNGYDCQCTLGFLGTHCEIDICSPGPCTHGQCVVMENNTPRCTCNRGWTGVSCDQDVLECASDPCKNGGACREEANGFVCDCALGFLGQRCDVDICSPNPCLNNGACSVSPTNMATCTCQPGWTGDTCSQDILECTSNPCQNNGTCKEKNNGYECACTLGYTGTHCTQDVCASFPCPNGRCVAALDNTPMCACNPGKTGERCDQEDLCYPDPCVNGNCSIDDVTGKHKCMCEFGFTGVNCTLDDFLNPLVILDRLLVLVGTSLDEVLAFIDSAFTTIVDTFVTVLNFFGIPTENPVQQLDSVVKETKEKMLTIKSELRELRNELDVDQKG